MSAPLSASVQIGSWGISAVPANWFFVPGFGLRHNSPYPTSNITVKDDSLLAGKELQPYVKAQITLLKRTYLKPAFAGPQPTELVPGSEETLLLLIRHEPLNGTRVMQVQTYARLGTWIGIVTLTTTEAMLLQVRKDYELFVRSLTIAPENIGPADPGA